MTPVYNPDALMTAFLSHLGFEHMVDIDDLTSLRLLYKGLSPSKTSLLRNAWSSYIKVLYSLSVKAVPPSGSEQE